MQRGPLVKIGSKKVLIKPEIRENISSKVTQCRLVMYEPCGHFFCVNCLSDQCSTCGTNVKNSSIISPPQTDEFDSVIETYSKI